MKSLSAPANNLCLSVLIAAIAGAASIGMAPLPASKAHYLPPAIAVAVAALGLIYRMTWSKPSPIDARLAHLIGDAEVRQSRLFVLVYCAGVIGCGAAYGYLGLASTGYVPTDDMSGWGLLDKRFVIFAYTLIGLFLAYHWMVIALFGGRPDGRRDLDTAVVRRVGAPVFRLGGALLAAVLAYCWLGLPALLSADPGVGPTLANFYEFHNHAQLGSLEQMRQGAIPYLEAQTQYGVGNLKLLFLLMRAVSFSSHGAFASCVLLDVACTIILFVTLQQALGLRWAIAGMMGWMLWLSPIHVIGLIPAWAILTRWLAVPLLSLLLARLFLNHDPNRRPWLGAVLAGLVWGVGSFLSQESQSGGLLVFILSLALYAAPSGVTLRSAVLFAGTFLATGIIVLVAATSATVGPTHWLEVYQLASNKAYLATAGITNTWWSDPLNSYSQWRAFLQTYGFAVLLVVVVGLLAQFFARRWLAAGSEARAFAAKFAGVAVGAFALHVFSLLRSDTTHLSGPSFLLPLCLLMLPVFVWRCMPPGLVRRVLSVVAVAIVFEGLIVGRAVLYRQLGETVTAWTDSQRIYRLYRDMRDLRTETPDLAARYSPLPRYQVAIRNHTDYQEVEDVFSLLRQKLHGRPVEFVFYRIDDLIAYPELFYFMGGFRSVSGITSPLTSIWVPSEFEAWIDKVVNASPACVFFEPNPDVRTNPRRALYQAWVKKTRHLSGVTTQPIQGRRLYGMLSCKP